MAVTPSNMLPLGTIAPNFALYDVTSERIVSLEELKADLGTVILFICNHCPFVKHIQTELVKVANEYQKKGICFIAISSNDIENYPEDAPEKMREEAKAHSYPFPYLFDETQGVARAYRAACTPDLYVFDKALKCVYRGRFDASSPGNKIPVTGDELRHALEALVNKKPMPVDQKPSMGCNIKWKDK